MNNNFSQLRKLIPRGQIVNIPEALANRTYAVCEGIHDNAIRHTYLQYLKYFFIARLPKAILQLVTSKYPTTFTKAQDEAVRIQDLMKTNNGQGCLSTCTVDQKDKSVNQIKGNSTQNLYRGNYRGHGGRG
jgi:hypothetical protein